MTTSISTQQVADDYLAAWAGRDLDRIMSLHAGDTRFTLHTGGTPAEGLRAVREAFAALLSTWPTMRFVTRRLLVGEGHWTFDWVLVADRPEGGELRVDCVDVVELGDDGLVAAKDTFLDASQLAVAA